MKATETAPNPVYSPEQTLLVTAGLFALVMGVLVTLTYPLLVAGLLATVVLTAVAVTLLLDFRRRTGRAKRVCVPRTGVCVEA